MKVKVTFQSQVKFLELESDSQSFVECNGLEKALAKMCKQWIRTMMVTADHEDQVPLSVSLAAQIEVDLGDFGVAHDRTPRQLFALLPSKERKGLRRMRKDGDSNGK